MVWQPTGGHATMDHEIKVGAQRPSMEVNPLLTHAELGSVKKILFKNPPTEKVFGFAPPKDPEGAREVMMIWKGHQASPSQDVTKPSPDFKTLNKMAVSSGLSDAKDLPFFRKMHSDVTVRTGLDRSPSATRRSALPTIPAAKVGSTFGMPSAHRSAEVIRTHGPEEPPVKYLVQGAYQDDWVRKNLEAEVTGSSRQRQYIPPQPTKAALGHSMGASRYLQPPNDDEPWKMSKFKTVNPRVTKYTGGSATRPVKLGDVTTAAAMTAAELTAEPMNI
ncbi:Cilia- and flagella-associated protein 77 [Pleodorina starrii]|nr:Cilia- and flagella-associated protein 77 [Pleodorina starrii]GLC76169.1 Cilia- and flagella-associated protein 77 [Pleodorina starrii]